MKKKGLKEAQIEKLLKRMGKSAHISPAFKLKMWWRLRKKAHELREPAGFFTWKKSLATAVAVIFIFTSTTFAYAYMSPSVTNGTTLYPLKRAIEDVEEKFQRSKEARAKFHAKMMERRIEEGKFLAEKGEEDQETLEMITNEFDQSVAIAQMIGKAEKRLELLKRIRRKLQKEKLEEFKHRLFEEPEIPEERVFEEPGEEPSEEPFFEGRRRIIEKIENRVRGHFDFIEMRIKGEPMTPQPPRPQPEPGIEPRLPFQPAQPPKTQPAPIPVPSEAPTTFTPEPPPFTPEPGPAPTTATTTRTTEIPGTTRTTR